MNSINDSISNILSKDIEFSHSSICRKILDLIDLTTLEGTDNKDLVSKLCDKALIYNTAAICVYPNFAKQVSVHLKGSGIKTACVAGGFPSSQIPLSLKLDEVKFALDNGADEIDMVLLQGAFLEGDYNRVGDEIAKIKEVCAEKHLKVILETGTLVTAANIERASILAIDNGADFIKTSTGKTPVSATLEAFYTMLNVIKEHNKHSNKKIGIKPAGGISTVDIAIPYFKLLYSILGNEWLNSELFRFGASRLADALYDDIS